MRTTKVNGIPSERFRTTNGHVEEIRQRSAEKQSPPPPPLPELPPPEPPLGHRSNGERTVGHGADGRFTKGNQCAAGRSFRNPFSRQQAVLRKGLVEEVWPRLPAIISTLMGMAEHGNIPAAALLFAYVLGKPGRTPDPDRLDLEEWQLLDQSPTGAEVMRGTLDSVNPQAACERVAVEMEKTFGERLGETERGEVPRQIIAMRDGRAGRKRKPIAPIPG
jgi:hypothetical protein